MHTVSLSVMLRDVTLREDGLSCRHGVKPPLTHSLRGTRHYRTAGCADLNQSQREAKERTNGWMDRCMDGWRIISRALKGKWFLSDLTAEVAWRAESSDDVATMPSGCSCRLENFRRTLSGWARNCVACCRQFDCDEKREKAAKYCRTDVEITTSLGCSVWFRFLPSGARKHSVWHRSCDITWQWRKRPNALAKSLATLFWTIFFH